MLRGKKLLKLAIDKSNYTAKIKPCGVPKEKTDSILKNLNQIIPENRKIFWENLNHL